MIYTYYRVSTDKQDYHSQKLGVLNFAKLRGFTIDKEIIDNGISGSVPAKDRKLGKLLKQLQKGDILITSELSRLGRSTSDVINTCQLFVEKGVNCYLVKQGMSIDNTPMGKMLIVILSAFAEMERDLISQRTREALAKKKIDGVLLGRPVGSKNKHLKLDGKEREIYTLLIRKIPKSHIANKLKVSINTLKKFISTTQI